MDFVAIDVETANSDMASICQIGIAKYSAGELAQEWVSYVDPEDEFDGLNIGIHGIDEAVVRGSPTFADLTDALKEHLEGRVAVCHTHFDRVAMQQAAERYELPPIGCTWLDSARVARRTWEQCSKRGYGLHDVCSMLGYEFRHHDALEDAKAAAHILLAASGETGLGLDAWLKRVGRRISPGKSARNRTSERCEPNPDGPLFGEVVVFTGALGMPRSAAADLAAKLGCKVASSVTKQTTILIVGGQNPRLLAGHDKSSKLRKAEALQAAGSRVRILSVLDFEALICS
jgi:DNA polymerase-3 subunit epsilon